MGIKIFYHICAMNHALAVVKEHIMAIHYSGLYEKAEAIYCFIGGGGDENVATSVEHFLSTAGKKISVVAKDIHDTSYERFTILNIHKMVHKGDLILYLHSKGVTRTAPKDIERIEDWTRALSYHLIGHHQECIDSLRNGYSAAGPNYDDRGIYPLHFSGNMWWTTADYFLQLPRHIGDGYLDPEFYLMQSIPNSPTPKVFAQHRIHEDLHKYFYKMERYVDIPHRASLATAPASLATAPTALSISPASTDQE